MPSIRMPSSSWSLVALVILTTEVIVLHHLHVSREFAACSRATNCVLALLLSCLVAIVSCPRTALACLQLVTTLYDMNANIT